MKPLPQLTPDCLIRYRYSGEWEYAVLHDDKSRTIVCAQRHLDDWRNGTPIPPLLAFRDETYKRNAMLRNENLRDKKTKVIQGVWKNDRFEPRKLVTP